MYTVADLFAGAGGLSLGFMQTGKYDIKVAFENNPDMQDTYRRNHPGVDVQGDICDADYSAISAEHGEIDVVIGGPPCQGFSNANRQKNQAISQNNMLVKKYINAILELQPKAFVMENVSMLKSEVHRFFLAEEDVNTVDQYKIPMKETTLQLIDREHFFNEALDIIKSREAITRYIWTDIEYAEMNVIFKASKSTHKLISALGKHKRKLVTLFSEHQYATGNEIIIANDRAAFESIRKYYDGFIQADSVSEAIETSIMIQRMLRKAKEIIENKLVVERYDITNGLVAVINSFAVYDYLTSILQSEKNGYEIKPDVLCAADYGAPQKRRRFVIVGIKKSISSRVALPRPRFDTDEYRTVRDAIFDLEDVSPMFETDKDHGITLSKANNKSDLAESLRDSKLLYNHIITNTTDTAMQRFKALKQGQNFHALDEKMKSNTYTDASRTQNTIYLRLDYDTPCGTVVNVRKSMWIHPTLDRAISVREAARLQTFPDSFIFCGTKDKQYQQVGNAVPPIMAKSIAEKLAKLLDKGLEDLTGG